MYSPSLCSGLILFLLGHLGSTSSSAEVCNKPLGLENGSISDTQISATSYYKYFYVGHGRSQHLEPRYARLNNQLAWCCPSSGKENYLTIDLKGLVNISGIATQGLEGISDYFVTSYRIMYGTDGKQWHYFKQTGSDKEKVWSGNSDSISVVKHMFPEVIQAQFIRVYPVSYRIHVCLRMELYGCGIETFTPKPTTPTVPTSQPTTGSVGVSSTKSTTRSTVKLPSTTVLPSRKATAMATEFTKDCRSPLGLESGKILDTQISASSYYRYFYIKRKTVHMKPEYARLNDDLAWCCAGGRAQECYLTVDFKSVVNITGIATQGIEGVSDYFVKEYRMVYGNDGIHWSRFNDSVLNKDQEKVWQGNKDGSSVMRHTFPNVIQARFLRVYPLSYNHYSCLRMELYGCSSGSQNHSTDQFIEAPRVPDSRAIDEKPQEPLTNSPSPKSHTSAKMGDHAERKRRCSAIVIGGTICSLVVLALFTTVLVLFIWRRRSVRKQNRCRYTTQVYLTEVAVEPGCQEMGHHISEELLLNEMSPSVL